MGTEYQMPEQMEAFRRPQTNPAEWLDWKRARPTLALTQALKRAVYERQNRLSQEPDHDAIVRRQGEIQGLKRALELFAEEERDSTEERNE